MAHGLEVVVSRECGHLPPEPLACKVGAAVVEAGPDSGFDELRERLRERLELPNSGPAWIHEGACDLERAWRVAEEHPQHGDVCAVQAVVSGDPLGIRRADERRPGGVRYRVFTLVLSRSWNGVPRPPEVEVVLVVPAVDRRVRGAQVLKS